MRKKSGMHAVELAIGSLVLIPLVLYGIDASVLYFAQSMNQTTCTNACRAAAAAPPSAFCSRGNRDPYRPRKRAEAVLKKAAKEGEIIQIKPTCMITEKVENPKPIAPWGGPVRGTIRLATTVQVNPPFLLPLMPKQVKLQTEQTLPITWVMPPNYSVSATPLPPSGGGDPDPFGGEDDFAHGPDPVGSDK